MVTLRDKRGNTGKYGRHARGGSKTIFNAFEQANFVNEFVGIWIVIPRINKSIPSSLKGICHQFRRRKSETGGQKQGRAVFSVSSSLHLFPNGYRFKMFRFHAGRISKSQVIVHVFSRIFATEQYLSIDISMAFWAFSWSKAP